MLHKCFRQHQETDSTEKDLCKTLSSPLLTHTCSTGTLKAYDDMQMRAIKLISRIGCCGFSLLCGCRPVPWPVLSLDSCQLNATLAELPPFLPVSPSIFRAKTHRWPIFSSTGWEFAEFCTSQDINYYYILCLCVLLYVIEVMYVRCVLPTKEKTQHSLKKSLNAKVMI